MIRRKFLPASRSQHSSRQKLYLSACRRKQTTKEIAVALKEGGVESTSKNFDVIVNNTMRILKKAGVVLQFKDGWALAELYPEAIRARINQQQASGQKAESPGKKRKKRKQAKARKEAPFTQPAKPEIKVQEMAKAS